MNKKDLISHKIKHNNETVLITGGNSGIGKAFISLLLQEEYKVIFTVRSKEKGEATIKEFNNLYPNCNLSYMLLDLSSLNSINNFAKEIIDNKIDIYHFYHNAGIFRIPYSKDEEGLEINTKTNFFSPYILNEKLMPYFVTLDHKVHINFTFSLTTYFYHLNYQELNPTKQYGKMKTYARTKIMIVHYYYYLMKKYDSTNLRFTLSHPGATYTSLIDKGYRINWFKHIATVFMKLVFHTPLKASYTYLLSLKEENDANHYICPRGLIELSGYPKYKKLRSKQYNNYEVTIEKTKELLKNHL